MKPIAIVLSALACFAFVVLAAVGSLVALPFVAAWQLWRQATGLGRARELELKLIEVGAERDELRRRVDNYEWACDGIAQNAEH